MMDQTYQPTPVPYIFQEASLLRTRPVERCPFRPDGVCLILDETLSVLTHTAQREHYLPSTKGTTRAQ